MRWNLIREAWKGRCNPSDEVFLFASRWYHTARCILAILLWRVDCDLYCETDSISVAVFGSGRSDGYPDFMGPLYWWEEIVVSRDGILPRFYTFTNSSA